MNHSSGARRAPAALLLAQYSAETVASSVETAFLTLEVAALSAVQAINLLSFTYALHDKIAQERPAFAGKDQEPVRPPGPTDSGLQGKI